MNKKMLVATALVMALSSISRAQELPGFRVIGRHLYDKCGERIILRGVANPNIWFQRSGLPQYEEIEKTGANVVRIVWSSSGTAVQLDAAIENCIGFSMIPMIENHDATGDWSKLGAVVDYWCRLDIVDVIQKHEEYLLLNIANECGDYNVSNTAFKTGYEAAIIKMREAGIHVPLVIDGSDWGKNIHILQSQGPALIQADPDHNLIFSIHMWWPKMYGFKESDIANELAQSVLMNLPLIVGEFSQMHGSCTDKTITDQNSISYLTIIKQCYFNEIGWIAWSWFGNCNPFWDMSSNGTFDSLYDWGLEVAVTDPYSIQNTSVRPYFIVNGACNPGAVEIHSETVRREGFELKQNYPNPFNSSTLIAFELNDPARVVLDVYDLSGRRIAKLVDDQASAGSHTVQWNGVNEAGDAVAGGVYVARMAVTRNGRLSIQANKMILIK
jgi:mannan endo-1,4-beta-mannosidase